MKRIVKIATRFIVIFLFLLIIFVLYMLNPQIMFANKQDYNGVTVYSQEKYDTSYNKVIDKALSLVRKSELYDSAFRMDIFINDGSRFPKILKELYGEAYAWGYHNNVILNGTPDKTFQWIRLNGYYRQMARTVAHEMIHCYQYHALGLFHSRPFKNIPVWKWEGYAEYVCYRSSTKDEKNILLQNIKRLQSYNRENFLYAETIVDEGPTFVGTEYLKFWVMVKYLMDVKGLSFKQILDDNITDTATYEEMIDWFRKNYEHQ